MLGSVVSLMVHTDGIESHHSFPTEWISTPPGKGKSNNVHDNAKITNLSS